VQEEVKRVEKAPNEYKKRKEQGSQLRKLKTRASRAEAAIAETEERIAELEGMLADGSFSADYEKVMEITNELSEQNDKLTELYEEWEQCLTEIEEQQ
ncbi:MAG: ABC transporter ATP-binding protein, partial [Christensenellaceae bacterium]|nr:ABC transporter ATP-binding protein [Christensenellaceae bacterium]